MLINRIDIFLVKLRGLCLSQPDALVFKQALDLTSELSVVMWLQEGGSGVSRTIGAPPPAGEA
jgi:hypothetical protein